MKLLILSLLFSLPVFSKTITLNSKNSVSFNQAFTSDYIAKKSREIMTKHYQLSPKESIYLVLNTPGGSVTDGNHFIDFIKALGRPVHTITIFAASMGYQTVQALGQRYIIPSGNLMSHRGTLGGISGQIPGEIEVRLAFWKKMMIELDNRASKRIGMSQEAYASLIHNELWLTSSDALKGKHADEIVDVVCDNTLGGTHNDTVMTPFGPFEVQFSNCPLITGPLQVERARNSAESRKILESYIKTRNNVVIEL